MPDNSVSLSGRRDLHAVLEQVRIDFVQRLKIQLRQLQSIRAQIVTPGCDDDLRELEFIAHKINGLAKTLGFQSLGDAAESLEVAIASLELHPRVSDPSEVVRLLDALVLKIRTTCAGAQD
ncbi:Hpt domain-containing protein [Phaeovulum sp.]|uniref:Hpt domain-containing protein n=1 Tax=Phaeovulum sp. TaxID=2934796 RepID=UPI0039E5A2F7